MEPSNGTLGPLGGNITPMVNLEYRLGLPYISNKYTGYAIKSEFQIKIENNVSIHLSQKLHGTCLYE